jgi:WD40 repeat protein
MKTTESSPIASHRLLSCKQIANRSQEIVSSWHRLILACFLIASALLTACSTKAKSPLEFLYSIEFKNGIQSLAWHPDGKRLAVGYYRQAEVEIWDIEAKKPLFTLPSKRTLVGTSGQEALFSPDGKYIVVKDFLDTKNGEPRWPQKDDETELQAQQDQTRYQLARVWEIETQKEVAKIFGPGSRIYGSQLDGMCWVGGADALRLAVLKRTSVFLYDPLAGEMLDEIKLRHPFRDYPKVSRGYEMMDCHPARAYIAMKGGIWSWTELSSNFYAEKSGITPIIIADVNQRTVSYVVESPDPLNGVMYTADGSKLVTYGAPPMRVWDVASGYRSVGMIEQKGNSDYLTPLSGFNGMIGLAEQLHVWDASSLQTVWREPAPADTFRIRHHAGSQTIAVASARQVFFYRYKINAINNIIAKKGN